VEAVVCILLVSISLRCDADHGLSLLWLTEYNSTVIVIVLFSSLSCDNYSLFVRALCLTVLLICNNNRFYVVLIIKKCAFDTVLFLCKKISIEWSFQSCLKINGI